MLWASSEKINSPDCHLSLCNILFFDKNLNIIFGYTYWGTKFLDDVASISLHINSLAKGMNPSVLPPTIDK